MWKPLIRCSIVGGVIVFLWFMISWMVLPMHKGQMNHFSDGSEVVSTILDAAPKDGIYVVPDWDTVAGSEDKVGPSIFVNVKRGVEFGNMATPMVIGLITQIIGAGLITYLLLKTKAMKYRERVKFVTIAGIAVGLLGSVPAWNWWHFPGTWVLFEFFDIAIAWFLGGLVIGKLVKN